MEKCGKYQWEIWNQLNGRNPCEFRTPRSKLGVNLQKSDCYGLDSERKKVLTSSPGPLACAYIHLGVFGSVGTHLPSVKSILPYFSSPRGVAILGCESHSQAGSARAMAMQSRPTTEKCCAKYKMATQFQLPYISMKRLFRHGHIGQYNHETRMFSNASSDKIRVASYRPFSIKCSDLSKDSWTNNWECLDLRHSPLQFPRKYVCISFV